MNNWSLLLLAAWSLAGALRGEPGAILRVQGSGGAAVAGTGAAGSAGAQGTTGQSASGASSTGGSGPGGNTGGINAGQTNSGPASVGQTGAGQTGAGPASGTGDTGAVGNSGVFPSPPEARANAQEPGGSPALSTDKVGKATGGPAGSVPATGNSIAPAIYTLGRTITDSLASSSDLVIANRQVEIDRRRADEAAAAGRPTLGVAASASRFDQATRVRIGAGPPVQVLGTHTEQISLNVGERLDLFGQIRASSNQAFLQSTADLYQFQVIRNGRIMRAKSIYFNLLRAQHQQQVAEAALANAQRQFAVARDLNAGQVGQKIDVYRAATQVATAQQQVTAAVNNRQIAEQNFNDLVGQPLASPVQVQDVPGVTVGTPVVNASSVGASAPAFTPFTVADTDVSTIDVGKSLQTALAARPELLVDAVNVRVAQTGITLARAGLEPSLTLNASGNYFPTTSFQTPRQRTAAVTATVNVPLYDGGATRDRIAEARLRTDNASTQLESDKSGVALDVRQSYLNLETAARQIGAANTALAQAIAARQLAQVRYEGQVGLYLEVTDAESSLVQAENSQVNAVYDYLVARAQFENAIGQPQIP